MKPRTSFVQQRYVLAVMGLFGIMTVYLTRLNLSIAIVAMVGHDSTLLKSSNNHTVSTCPAPFGELEADYEKRIGQHGEFDWGSGWQGHLLGSYYWGYIFTQIPGGWLAYRLGFKWVFGLTMLLSSIFTFLTPLCAEAGIPWLLAIRIMIGVLHGVSFPAMQGAWGHWAPPKESSRLVSIHIAGASVGTVIIFPMSGLLADSYGWRSIFYVTGAMGLVWCLFWFVLVFDSPQSHPWISQEEEEYIVESISTAKGEKRVTATPWREILTCPAVWALTIGHTSSNWGNYQLNTMMPTYFDNVLKFDIKTNGLLSAVPFLFQSIVCFAAGFFTDLVRRKGWMRTITIRKINTGLGLVVPAITIVLAGYMGCNAGWALTFFIISLGFNTFTVPGCKTSMLDFAPAFSAVIFGVSNTVANFTGFLAPQTTGLLLQDDNSLERWQLAFWISALVYLPGFFLFLIFGTDELQEWAKEVKEGGEEKDKEKI